MTHDAHQKVKTSHLKRNAYLYVRQSTLRKYWRTPRARNGSTRSGNTLLRWVGRWTESS